MLLGTRLTLHCKILFLKNSITKICPRVLSYKTGRKKCVICLHHLRSSFSICSGQAGLGRSRRDKNNIAVILSRAVLTSLIIADTPSPGQSASDYLDVVVIKFNDFLSPPSLLIICLTSQRGLGWETWGFNLCSRWDNISQASQDWVCVRLLPAQANWEDFILYVNYLLIISVIGV